MGLKIHPDFRYQNLYHWVLGDKKFWRDEEGEVTLPDPFRPYAEPPADSSAV